MSDAFVQPELEVGAEPRSDPTARREDDRPASDTDPPSPDVEAPSPERPRNLEPLLFIVFDEYVATTPQGISDRWRDLAPYDEAAFHVVLRAPRHRKPRTRRERRRWGVRKPLVRYGS